MVAQMTASEQTKTPAPFVPDTYACCKSGRLMPCRLTAVTPDGTWAEVVAPGGQEYSFPTERLLSVEEAEEKLHSDRVAKVVSTYRFEVISSKPLAVKVTNPEHPRRSNYMISQMWTGELTCSCPAFSKSGIGGVGCSCKHTEAFSMKREQEIKAAAVPACVAVSAADW